MTKPATHDNWKEAIRNHAVPALNVNYVPNYPNMGNWKDRHKAAILAPVGFERAIVGGLRAWIDYAAEHAARYGSGIGEDYILGPFWEDWGRCLLGLLDGETGRLDCGTLDAIIRESLMSQGFEEE